MSTGPDPGGLSHRFFCPDVARAWIAGGGQAGPAPVVELPGGEAHHAAHVLRLSHGQVVELFDGQGLQAAGRIVSVRKGHVAVSVERVIGPAARTAPLVHLAFAVPKGSRLDWLLEKATELGAASLRPTVFERSVAGGELTAGKRDRWLGHCVAAAKQCGLNWLPELCPAAALAEVLGERPGALRLAGDVGGASRPIGQAMLGRAGREVVVLVGPEGGFTPQERDAIAGAGFVPVRLGRTTLRVETAAVALLAAVIASCE